MNKNYFRIALIFLIGIGFNGLFGASDSVDAGTAVSIHLPKIINSYDSSGDEQIFGVQMYGDTGTTSPYHPYLVGSGSTWLRINASWRSIEPNDETPKSYNWAAADQNLQAARTDMGGLKLIVTIDDNPGWASDNEQGPIDEPFIDDFAAMMGAFVERYDGDGVDDAPGSPVVRYWELYNEPDRSADGERWGNAADQYVAMLKAVYPAVKSANPNALVVLGGLSYDWFEEEGGPFNRNFLADVLAAGGGDYMDVMNFHSYPFFSQNWTGVANQAGIIAKTNAVREVMDAYGWDAPIIITESGTHDNDVVGAPSSPEIQSRYVVSLFTEGLVADLDALIWWMLYDFGNFYPYNNGLVTNSSNPVTTKQSYTVFQNAVQELGTARYVRTLSAAEIGSGDVSAHMFSDPTNGRDLYVVWRSVVTENAYTVLQLPLASAIVRDSVTFTTTVVNDADDGVTDNRITLPVNGRPLYVEVNQ